MRRRALFTSAATLVAASPLFRFTGPGPLTDALLHGVAEPFVVWVDQSGNGNHAIWLDADTAPYITPHYDHDAFLKLSQIFGERLAQYCAQG